MCGPLLPFHEDDTLILQILATEAADTSAAALLELTVSHNAGDIAAGQVVLDIASGEDSDNDSTGPV